MLSNKQCIQMPKQIAEHSLDVISDLYDVKKIQSKKLHAVLIKFFIHCTHMLLYILCNRNIR